MTPDPAGAAPFHWTAEHEEFRGVVRKLTETRAPLACVPSPGSQDPRERELWRTWTTEALLAAGGLGLTADAGAEGSIRKLTHAQLEVTLGLPRDRDPHADKPFEERPRD